MNVVVVYESMYGNRHQIAEAIGRGLTEEGAQAEVVSVDQARKREIGVDDVLIVGAPTHVHGLSRESTREAAVKGAAEHAMHWRLIPRPRAQACATGSRLWDPEPVQRLHSTHELRAPRCSPTGQASQLISKALSHHGFDQLAAPESFLVASTNQLLPEEAAHARQWGADLATKILPVQP